MKESSERYSANKVQSERTEQRKRVFENDSDQVPRQRERDSLVERLSRPRSGCSSSCVHFFLSFFLFLLILRTPFFLLMLTHSDICPLCTPTEAKNLNREREKREERKAIHLRPTRILFGRKRGLLRIRSHLLLTSLFPVPLKQRWPAEDRRKKAVEQAQP